jgi:hypothetical protein
MPDGRRIDFVVSAKNADRLYVEVKTVHPRTEDNDRNWNKVAGRQQRHQPGTHYIVGKKWMGAAIYTNSFAARGKFLDYTVEFESRLAQAVKATPGRGALVFCGNGFAWHLSELEDFAQFYHTGRHRTDDPFAAMETHGLAKKEIKLLRNIDAFGYMKRSHDGVRPEEYAFHTA